MTEGPTMGTLLAEHWHLARNLRSMKIHFAPERCKGLWQCYEVCPVGCWAPDYDARCVVFIHGERCVACGACVLQCPEKAIELR